MKDAVAAIRARDRAALREALAEDPALARRPRLVVEAAGEAWLPGLAELARRGADLNASYRNYRPLHALIQSKPHGATAADDARLACLAWLLDHGADQDELGAWPLARAPR